MLAAKRIRVLVADDSRFVCRLLASFLESSGDVDVVGTALDGRDAIEKIKDLRPDAVTLDLEMPKMDGLEALAEIMRDCPTPVVAISGVSGRSAMRTLRALELGAVDFVLKYTPGENTRPEDLCREIVAKVRAASKVRVIRSRPQKPTLPAPLITAQPTPQDMPGIRGGLIVIGASTGGPLALRELLSRLPEDFPAAILIVQHMPGAFTGVLAAQLHRHSSLRVREAEDGAALEAGLVLVAPGGFHLLVQPSLRVTLQKGPEVGGHCPAIDVTMESAAQAYGMQVKGVLLTGMGEDGAKGMAAIRARGGVTYAQDAASCVVNGMPLRAIERGVVDHIAPPAEIGDMLLRKAAAGTR
jgi:two-component system, chemotaxis family, protein-glutamate methylesterase/glutaminase